MTELIISSFVNSRRSILNLQGYPDKPGIYALNLSNSSDLGDFGISGQFIYIGIAKYSLRNRDFSQHFKSGKTGSSTLRRSLGAILKNNLQLQAVPRGGENDSKRFENYKFLHENILTDWMIANLEIGYWQCDVGFTYNRLRDVEKELTLQLKPTLDLDNRTRRFNPLADRLQALRESCKLQAQNKSLTY